MTSRAWAVRIRCALGAFVALAAASFPSPRAEAGCSTYVRVPAETQSRPESDLLGHSPETDLPALVTVTLSLFLGGGCQGSINQFDPVSHRNPGS